MSRPHYYSGLDKDSMVSVEIPMRELAERVESLNYGVHRFLSHLVDVRREQLKARVEKYRLRGDVDVAASVEKDGDALADGIESLLKQGLV